MKKHSWLTLAIPTGAGLLFGFLMGSLGASLFQTLIDLFVELVVFIAPYLIIIFFGFGIAMIRGKVKYLGKYFGKLLLILGACSLFAYFIAVLLVTPFVNNFIEMGDNYIPIETLFDIPDLWDFPIGLSILIGLILGFLAVPEKSLHKNLEKISHLVQKYLLSLLKYLIPIIIFASFSLITYSNKFQDFFIVDLYLSFLIIAAQVLWLMLMGFLTTLQNRVSRIGLWRAMGNNFLLGMTYLPSEFLMVNYVDNIKKANIREEVAFSTYILSAQLSKPGSIIATIIFAYGVMCMSGLDVSLGVFLPFLIAVVFGTMIASSVPGGVWAITSTYVVSILGFSESMVSLMQVMYWKQGTVNSGANVASHAYMASAMED